MLRAPIRPLGAGAAKGMPDSGGQNVAKRHTYPPASWDLPLSAKEMSGCPIPVFLAAAEELKPQPKPTSLSLANNPDK